MTIQTPSNDPSAPAPETSKDIGELSFSDFQKVRRGEASVESVQSQSAPTPKKETEAKKVAESDTAKAEEVESEDESEVDGDEPETKDSEKSQPKKKGGFQRRIDKLNQRASAAQQEAEYWKGRALRDAQATPKHDAETVDSPLKADDAGKPDLEKFDTHAEYVEALTDWKIENRERAREEKARSEQILTEQQKLMKSHSERVKTFAQKTEDFQDVIEAVDDVPISAAVRELIVSSDHSAELMYELAKNRAEYERINQLPPLAAAREMGKLESKIAANSSVEKNPEPKKLTKAPKPIEPVGSGKGHVAKSIDDPGLSYSDYERIRRQQKNKRRT